MRIKFNHFFIFFILVLLTASCALRGGPPARRPPPAEGQVEQVQSNQVQSDNAYLVNYQADSASTVLSPEGLTLIPAGTFQMGDHHNLGGREHGNDEVPLHSVSLASFFIAPTEVSNQQYADYLNSVLVQGLIEVRDGAVYGSGGTELYFTTRSADQYSPIAWDGKIFAVFDGREKHPATSVRWAGAAAYTNWLSVQNGYQGCYDLSTWQCDFSRSGYRLPTEAEWEYAGRGGLTSPYAIFPWGDGTDHSRANWPNSGDPFEVGPQPWTTPVGFYNGQLHHKSDFGWPGQQESYQTADGANDYGLYDMAGNVWEWTHDWYGRDYYGISPADNPTGPENGSPMPDGKPYHTLRGGNWYNGEWGHSRVSNRDPGYYRGPQDPNHPYYHVGFRVVLDDDNSAAQDVTSSSVSDANRTVGLILNTNQASQGYTLFAPKHNTATYLIDNKGQVVHAWTGSKYEPGQSVYLLENGHLLRACMTRGQLGTGGGEGGRIEEYDWDDNLVWEFDFSNDQVMQHHDIEPLPNGNILLLAIEKKSYDETIAAGFDPDNLNWEIWRKGQMLPDSVFEIKPTYPSGGEIVWEWHVWDHLVQDFDPAKSNYGAVATHPELVDAAGIGREISMFWNHMNSIDYNPNLDQIMLSVRGNSEIWVIDHSATSAEAAGHSGGKSGKGGDLLYRWGNPAAYQTGSTANQQLFDQHDAQWIEPGLPGAGNILIFSNGNQRKYSSVEEIVPPLEANGNYTLAAGSAFGPSGPLWHYQANNPSDFFSEAISGMQRLPNGNTLIDDGVHGVFFEVTPTGQIVWVYINPVINTGPLAQDGTPPLDHRGHQLNAAFKIHRYTPAYPGLVGRDLSPSGPLEIASSLGQGSGSVQNTQAQDQQPQQKDQPDPQLPEVSITANQDTYGMCIYNTSSNPECKDCCDMLETDGQTRKECRDTCATHDFNLNTEFILLDVTSILGRDGDYSICTVSGDERECKRCCDSSTELTGGDRRFCRDVCAGR